MTKSTLPQKGDREHTDKSGSKTIILKKRKQKENVLNVLSSIAKNLSDKLLSIETEKKIEEAVCEKCNIDSNTFQGVYQFWISNNDFISASYLITEYERSLGTSEALISTSKYKNCIRLGIRKGLTDSESTEFVNIFITKHNMRLEKEVLQEMDNLILTWCISNLANNKYTQQDLEKLTTLVANSFDQISTQRIKKCIDEYIRKNGLTEKKGLFGLGFMGL